MSNQAIFGKLYYYYYRIEITAEAQMISNNYRPIKGRQLTLESISSTLELPVHLDLIPIKNCPKLLNNKKNKLVRAGDDVDDDLCTVLLRYTTTVTGTAVFTQTTTWGTKVSMIMYFDIMDV